MTFADSHCCIMIEEKLVSKAPETEGNVLGDTENPPQNSNESQCSQKILKIKEMQKQLETMEFVCCALIFEKQALLDDLTAENADVKMKFFIENFQRQTEGWTKSASKEIIINDKINYADHNCFNKEQMKVLKDSDNTVIKSVVSYKPESESPNSNKPNGYLCKNRDTSSEHITPTGKADQPKKIDLRRNSTETHSSTAFVAKSSGGKDDTTTLDLLPDDRYTKINECSDSKIEDNLQLRRSHACSDKNLFHGSLKVDPPTTSVIESGAKYEKNTTVKQVSHQTMIINSEFIKIVFSFH